MKRFFISVLCIISLGLTLNARQPQRGYRGFIDWSNSMRSQEYWVGSGHYTEYYTGFSTTHGMQFNPRLFVGGGLDFEYYSDYPDHILSLFADVRTDLKFNKFTPFGDLRLGYNFVNGGGLYCSPTIGYRFNWGRKVGINLGIGATLIGYKVDTYDIVVEPSGHIIYYGPTGSTHKCRGYFSFRIGFDF